VILDDLSDLLSTGTAACASILKGSLQDRPDTTLCLREVGGRPADHAMSSGPGHAVAEHPRVQVIARDPTYEDARLIAHRAYVKLDGLAEVTKNSTLYHWITAVQPPFLLGIDDNDRTLIAFNVDITKGLSAT